MARVPKSYKEGLLRTQKLTPTVEMVMKEAATMEAIPQEKRDQIQRLLDAGEFSKLTVTENQKRTKLIDMFVDREIKKSVKAGRLPTKKQLALIPGTKEMYDKVYRNALST